MIYRSVFVQQGWSMSMRLTLLLAGSAFALLVVGVGCSQSKPASNAISADELARFELRAKGLVTASTYLELQHSGNQADRALALGYLSGVMDTLSFAVSRYELNNIPTDVELIDKIVIAQLKLYNSCLNSKFQGLQLGTFAQELADRMEEMSEKSRTQTSGAIGIWSTTCGAGFSSQR